jgi:DNA-binding transcriptional LysR family regulator
MGTIDLNALPLFVAVAETSSFSEAARRLGVPKSSVSRGVAALEASMGVRLVHRTTRRVSLSTAGSALLGRVAPALASLQKSVGDMPELAEEPSGKLRVTTSVDLGTAVLADVAARFARRYPKIDLELCITNAVVDLVAEGFDAALRISARAPKDSTLLVRPIASLCMQLFAAPSYLARIKAPRAPADLAEHEWIVFRAPAPVRVEGPDGRATLVPRGRLVCDDMFFARECARHGAGIALLPTFLADADVAEGRLVRVLPQWHTGAGRLSFVCPAARHLPRKVTAFRDFVVELLKARPFTPAS